MQDMPSQPRKRQRLGKAQRLAGMTAAPSASGHGTAAHLRTHQQQPRQLPGPPTEPQPQQGQQQQPAQQPSAGWGAGGGGGDGGVAAKRAHAPAAPQPRKPLLNGGGGGGARGEPTDGMMMGGADSGDEQELASLVALYSQREKQLAEELGPRAAGEEVGVFCMRLGL